MVVSVKASIKDWLPEINEMRAEVGLPAFETHPYRPESVGLVSFDIHSFLFGMRQSYSVVDKFFWQSYSIYNM